jgi:hypothetical protein
VLEVTRVDYVRVPGTDVDAANRFYGEVLGLTWNPSSPADYRVEYEACHGAGFHDPAGNRILLHHRYTPPYPDGSNPDEQN